MFVVFSNKTSCWFKYVCIKMWTYTISARFHSLTKMSPDCNGSDLIGQTEKLCTRGHRFYVRGHQRGARGHQVACGHRRSQGVMNFLISSISCFVLWEALSLTKSYCSLKVKIFGIPQNFGLATRLSAGLF